MKPHRAILLLLLIAGATYVCAGPVSPSASVPPIIVTNIVTSGPDIQVAITNGTATVSLTEGIQDITATGGVVTVGFDGKIYQRVAIGGATTIDLLGMVAGRAKALIMTNSSGSDQTLTFPAVTSLGGGTLTTTNLVNGKTAVFSVTSTGTTTQSVLGAYAAQP